MEINHTGNRKHREADTRGIERVNGFSDAVFAVAITLLILTIDVPSVSDISQLPSELTALWPKFEGFLISFFIIGSFWLSHHVIFRYIRRHRQGMLWINLFFLLFIVLLPFSTDLMSEYSQSTAAVVFYDLNMVAASISICLLWWYVSYRHPLVDGDLDPSLRWHLILVFLNMTAIFLVSAGIAFVNPPASQYLYLLLIPNTFLIHRMRRRAGEPAPGRAEDEN